MGNAGVVLLWFVGVLPRLEADSLDRSYKVDWRGIPLQLVLEEISGETRWPVILDAAVQREQMDQRLRAQASHLTGWQALRWAARLAGLEAVRLEDAILVGPPSRLPVTWRRLSASSAEAPPPPPDRRVDVDWLDSPLSAVAREVSSGLGVDVLFHPEILAEQRLVQLQAAQTPLDAIRGELERQLDARTEFIEGAVWVVPVATPPASAPAPVHRPIVQPPAGRLPRALVQRVVIGRDVQSWADLCTQITQVADIPCFLVGSGQPAYVPFEADGFLIDVLEAGRSLDRLSWQYRPAAEGASAVIEVRAVAQSP